MPSFSFVHLSLDGIRRSVPLDTLIKATNTLIKATKGNAKTSGHIPLDKLDTPVFAYWDANLGPGSVIIQSKLGEETRDITPSKKKGAIVWLPPSCIARFQPDAQDAYGWTLAVTRNGTVRSAYGSSVGISKDAEIAPDNAPSGTSETLTWMAEGNTGPSALAMAHRLMGIYLSDEGYAVFPKKGEEPPYGSTAHPHDPADFNRCVKFLDAVPEARGKLNKMADVSPTWAALVRDWDSLEATFREETKAGDSCPQTYQAIKAIVASAEVANSEGRRKPGF